MSTGRHRAASGLGRHRAVATAGWRQYLADRGAVPTLAAVSTVAITVTVIVNFSDSHGVLDQWWSPTASIGPLLAVVFMTRTLAGDDVGLEQTIPRLRSRWRMNHAILAVMLSSMLMSIGVLSGLQCIEVLELIRNVFGFFGLALLTSPVLSAASAWAPTAGYTFFTLLTFPRDSDILTAWWAWHLQPSTRIPSWLAAAALLAVGMTAYVRLGPLSRQPST